MNVMMLLEMANSAFPDRIAFTNGATGETLSYSQLFSKAGERAREIRASDSNRFVKLDVSSLVTPLSLFASGWAGIPYVPLNYRLTDEEIMRLIERVKPATLVTSEDRINSFQNLEGLEVLDSSDLLSHGGEVFFLLSRSCATMLDNVFASMLGMCYFEDVCISPLCRD